MHIYIYKIRHLLSGVTFRFLPNLRRLNKKKKKKKKKRNRNITPDNKCLIFYIYIWTFNIDIQSLHIFYHILFV